MQKTFNTKSKFLFLTFFVSLSSVSLQAFSQPALTINIDNINQEQLSNALNSMNPQEQEQLIKLLEEVANISDSNKTKDCNKLVKRLQTFFNNIPYARLSGVALCLVIAMYYWEVIGPKLEERFPKWKTSTELPKLVAGALILDGIKDFLKEIRLGIENSFSLFFTGKPSQNDACLEEVAAA